LTAAQKRYKFYTVLSFQFDKRKSAANKEKHGIDFTEAQAIWGDPDFIEIPARTEDEPRFLVVGRIAGVHWSAVITYRGASVRIISVRPARVSEVQAYEG
jgi:uncharacterized DUF497 family protein